MDTHKGYFDIIYFRCNRRCTWSHITTMETSPLPMDTLVDNLTFTPSGGSNVTHDIRFYYHSSKVLILVTCPAFFIFGVTGEMSIVNYSFYLTTLITIP